jgi:AraC-like DNA-binding protein
MTVSVTLVQTLLEAVERAGGDPDALLAECGLDRSLIEAPSARFDAARYDALHERALDVTGDPALGLHLAEHARLAAFHLVGFLTANCRTIRQALGVFARYRRLLSDVEAPTLVEDGDLAILTCYFVQGSPRGNRLRAEFGMTAVMRTAQDALGLKEAPRLVEFIHAAPDHAAEYARVFGCDVRFGAAACRIHIPREVLDRPQIHANRDLFHLLETRAVSDLASLPAPTMTVRVRAAIVEHYDGTRPSMDDIAKRLGISSRSLRRRLQEEQAAFPDLVDEAMAEIARVMLLDPSATIHDIADRLGFSEPSAFHRAFKRWTGLTPGQFRGHEPIRD